MVFNRELENHPLEGTCMQSIYQQIGLACIALACLLGAVWRSEQRTDGQYPDQPIKLIVPFSPGGGTDTFARTIKKGIEETDLLPQPLVIMNIKGAGATIGSRKAKVARPDGYTLLLLHDSLMTAKASGQVNYGVEAFDPIAATGELGMVLCVAQDAPYQNLQELLQAAKERPDTIRFGVNMGAIVHFAALTLEDRSPGTRFLHVQSGSGAERFGDIKGGHTEVTAFSIEEYVRFRTDVLRAVCFFGETRHPAVPEVPTAREQGIDVVFANRFYWWAPRETPAERRAYVADVLEKAMQTEYVRTQLSKSHTAPIFIRDEALVKAVQQSEDRYQSIQQRDAVVLPDIPMFIMGSLLVIGLLMFIPWLRKQSRRPPGDQGDGELARQPSRMLTPRPLLGIGATLLYAGLLALFQLDFRMTTTCYLFVMALTIMPTRQRWSVALAFSVAMALSIHFVLQGQFGVLLP